MATLPDFPAVRTAAGDVQADIGRGAVELDDHQAVDVALSLLASADLPPYLRVLLRDFAEPVEAWLNSEGGERPQRYTDFADRCAAVAPPAVF